MSDRLAVDAIERRRLLDRLRAVEKRRETAVAKLEAIERERGNLYSDARALDPPIRWTDLAAISKITPEAVQQKLDRHGRRR